MAVASTMNLNDDSNSNKQNQSQSQNQNEHDEHEHDMVMPGFRFHPTEEELVEFYLRRKVEGKKFNVELITFLDLYRYDPWELPALAAIGEKEWFFYVPRDRKYRNGDRPNRVTTSGYWKATGADRMIRAENFKQIGLKKTLVFYSGKAPKGIRTSWIMNEYRLPQHETERYQKVEISLCRVYKRAGVEDHPSLPRGVTSKPSARGTPSSSEKKHNCYAGDHSTDQTDASSSTEVGTALGLNNTTSSAVLAPIKMEKTIHLSKQNPSVPNPTSPLLGNCTALFMGSSGPPSNPIMIDDLHRLVSYQQQTSIMTTQPPLQFQGTVNHATTPSALYSNLLSTVPGGSSLAPAPFSDRLWDWNAIQEQNLDFNSSFK